MPPPSDAAPTIRPVILSGGSGTRLWPLSRSLYPKQMLPLAGDRTLLQQTALRAIGPRFSAPVIIANDEHRFLVAEQMREIDVAPEAIILEPMGRNSAAAAAVAALLAGRAYDGEIVLLMSSDHVIDDVPAFHEAVWVAQRLAEAGYLATFGIDARTPETRYGYIDAGAAIDGIDGGYQVKKFEEKPDEPTALEYVSSGGHYWNSGIFAFRPDILIEELDRQQPGMSAAVSKALDGAAADLDFLRLDGEAFARVKSISIDYAVMEGTERAAVVPVDMGWSDLGAWDALWAIERKDENGNVLIGDVVARGTRNSYVRSDHPMVAVSGVDDLIIVATADAVLAVPMSESQSVKELVDRMKAEGRPEHESHIRVYRPWGWYQSLEAGGNFQVKLIQVNPGAKISLQKHRHRAEHWVVVGGRATVTRDGEAITLEVNQSTYIPIGMMHRLENKEAEPLRIIEVQSGDYLGEDDIERFDDSYGRA